jgi:patatin-related protein
MTDQSGVSVDLQDFAKQEIRLAAVLNGGVSLAVWMSGVTLEMHHLAMASAGARSWNTYRDVLDALGATARVDVIAGTSAGGLNGAFLALGLARKRDFSQLRDVWADAGSLEKLLRKPLTKSPPSALAGDEYFLVQINEALRQMSTHWPDLGTDIGAEMPGVELFLTGTLWEGRQTRFSDDMGVGITERDYNATFRFSWTPDADPEPGTARSVGDLAEPSVGADPVLAELANAARCTSSFPAAFEPHYVTVEPDLDGALPAGRWPSSAGQSNFDASQYVLDGGILLNKPLRPALDAIYQQTAQNQVRRVLGYVVPDPGEPPDAATTGSGAAKVDKARPEVPGASDVLLGVLTRLSSTDSVSRELGQIRDTNATVRAHRRARGRLSLVLTRSAAIADTLWKEYIEERIDNAASTAAGLVARGQATRPVNGSAADDQWTLQQLTADLSRIGRGTPGFGFVPSHDTLDRAVALTGGDWTWGQTTLVRLADMTVDLMKRAVMLARVGSPEQERIVAARAVVSATLRTVTDYSQDLDDFWIRKGATGRGTMSRLDWLAAVVQEWDRNFESGETGRRADQHRGALELAAAIGGLDDVLIAVAGGTRPSEETVSTDVEVLRALHAWLLANGPAPEAVLGQMLRLDVVLVATSGALSSPEQEVELVEISCGNRDDVTGMQLHHFGAFYRKSWRVNDWVEGRMDGIRQVIRLLLDPARFRQLGRSEAWLRERFRAIAIDDGGNCTWLTGADREWLASRWDASSELFAKEVTDALNPDAATTFDRICEAIALPLQVQALRDDLPALASAIAGEGKDTQLGSASWLAQYESAVREVKPSLLSAAQLWALRTSMSQVGSQKIADDVGSDTFARTTSHAAVITTGAFTARTNLKHVKPVQAVISALRGYTAMVYAMVAYLSRGSKIGPMVVGMAAAAGGVLLAVTIFVPGVPIGLTLAGVLLLLAAASAAALRTPEVRWMAARVGLVALLFAAALGYLIYRDVDAHGFHGEVVSTVVKLGIGLAVLLVGWFVANGGWTLPSRVKRREDRADDARADLSAARTALNQADARARDAERAARDARAGVTRAEARDRASAAKLDAARRAAAHRARAGAGKAAERAARARADARTADAAAEKARKDADEAEGAVRTAEGGEPGPGG